jgi:hypothetical protein
MAMRNGAYCDQCTQSMHVNAGAFAFDARTLQLNLETAVVGLRFLKDGLRELGTLILE